MIKNQADDVVALVLRLFDADEEIICHHHESHPHFLGGDVELTNHCHEILIDLLAELVGVEDVGDGGCTYGDRGHVCHMSLVGDDQELEGLTSLPSSQISLVPMCSTQALRGFPRSP